MASKTKRDDSGRFAPKDEGQVDETEARPEARPEERYPDAFPQGHGPGPNYWQPPVYGGHGPAWDHGPQGYPPQGHPGYYQPAPRGGNGVAIFMFLMVVVMGAVLAYVAWTDKGSTPAPAPTPDGGDVTQLSREIGQVLNGHERAAGAADYMEWVCRAVANRVKADGNEKEPRFITREEASEAMGEIGYYARVGNFTGQIAGLDDVVQEAFKGTFPENDKGEELGGELTKADRTEFVERLMTLSKAFAQH